MAIEVELKAWVNDVDQVRSRIREIAEYKGSFDKQDIYFSKPDAEKSLFRIRQDAKTNTITYKEKERKDGIEVNREHEFHVDDAEVFSHFCAHLGYEVFIKKHKKGELFAFDTVGIELSHIEGLGWFVEVEMLVKAQSEVQFARQKVREVLQLLRIPEVMIEPRYYNEMLKEEQ